MQSLAPIWAVFVLSVCACAAAPVQHDGRAKAYEERWLSDVEELAGARAQSRGIGEPGLERAGEWIATRFEEIGLEPMYPSYEQEFKAMVGDEERVVKLFNVIGRLPAKGESTKAPIVVSAHYDHLRSGSQIFRGADDNASGVATLLGVARELASMPERERTFIFAAFTGEEESFLGSQFYADHIEREPALVVVLDMVGRLENSRIYVDSNEPSFERLARDEAARARLVVEPAGALGRSDAEPFRQREIPTMVVSTGFHDDYHRPTDTIDRLNLRGAIRVQHWLTRVATRLMK